MSAGDEYYEDLLKVQITYTGERNTAANIFYLSCSAAHGATLDQLETLAEYIGTQWKDGIMPSISSAVSCETCLVSDWTSADGLTGLYDVGQAGSLTGDPLPAQVATLINYTTNLRYRGGRGRMYLPQATGTELENDQSWTTDFIGGLEAQLATLMSGINEQTIGSNAVTWVLYHRGTTHVPQGVEDVLVLTVSPTPGTQRRRVRRVGHKR
jgi:hypothetical protein